MGGLQIGNSNYWIGDYTIEPENGGVGVFAHEFAHDLGLPDLYATQGGENSTAWWTIMSQGSYGTVNGQDLGSAPTHFSAWEKFQLGFLNGYSVATNESSGTYHLGPAEFNTKKPQAMFVVLPDKVVTRTSVPRTRERCSITRDCGQPGHHDGPQHRPSGRLGQPEREGPLQHRGGLRLRLSDSRWHPVSTNLSNSSVLARVSMATRAVTG